MPDQQGAWWYETPKEHMGSDLKDVIIIGAGPTGLACAIEAKKTHLNCLVIEKGCIVNSIQNFPVQMTFFTTPELLEIGGLPFVSSYEKPTRLEALKYYRRTADTYHLKLHLYETVLAVEGADGDFRVKTQTRAGGDCQYRSKKIVLATGYYDIPNLLRIPGEDLSKVAHYYTEAHPYYGMDVAVIGGKNSAAIAALDLYRHGARVTLIHRGRELSHSIKYWIKPDIENRIKSREIDALFETSVVEIAQEHVLLRNAGGSAWPLKNDFVFAMTGYRPDLEFFEALGIRLNPADQRPYHNKETYESGVAGIYLAGVVVAGMHTNEVFIENGRFHGEVIIKDIRQRL
ncbi:MAG: YpdA family putative bacillithiol disulfide reductase [Acidobacteria bacterium]|nr:YpdA family putative bacillithiol disulfide reductase [Acidobacteriota bacterium]MCI0623035.1 YpdA family putative bacillithiol disulfide reductase [Acidobacteriota bacterium]MCI0720636.1 YpdA family putative bacillithiol disulfide reductase [Acidobacteriota bacterium]